MRMCRSLKRGRFDIDPPLTVPKIVPVANKLDQQSNSLFWSTLGQHFAKNNPLFPLKPFY